MTLSPSLPLLLSGLLAAGRGDRWQAQESKGVVVGGDAVLTLDAAAVAAVHHHLLPIRPVGNADGRHQGPARAGTIARPPQIDVAGSQAEGTVIAMSATGDGRPDESTAAAALERIALVLSRARAEGSALPLALSL